MTNHIKARLELRNGSLLTSQVPAPDGYVGEHPLFKDKVINALFGILNSRNLHDEWCRIFPNGVIITTRAFDPDNLTGKWLQIESIVADGEPLDDYYIMVFSYDWGFIDEWDSPL